MGLKVKLCNSINLKLTRFISFRKVKGDENIYHLLLQEMWQPSQV